MTQIAALLKTSREALQLARSLQDAGRTAPATYYACHAFEMGGNAFVAAREVELKPSHSNLNRFRTQYHRAGLKRSLDPVLLRVRALREPSRYPLEDPERTGEWIAPSDWITQEQADRLLRRVNGALYDVIFPNVWS